MTNSLKHFRLALLALAALTVGCVESSDPSAPAPVGTTGGLHALVVANGVASDITLDQVEAAVNIGIGYGNGGTHVGKELDQNPHPGDAIVVTFTWRGSTNTITDVTDHLEDGTPVGNSYSLVDYTTVNGWSAATYVAINVGGFPYPSPSFDKNLAVHAIFSDQVTEAGELIAAYRGVSPVVAQAIGAHHAATGTGTTTTIADPGAISVNAGAVAYTFTTSTGAPDLTNPANFGWITAAWDSTNKIAAAYALPPAGVVDPQWAWSFQSPNSWSAHVLALNPQVATHLGFVVQPSSTTLPGQTIAPAVQVAVLDDQGKTVTGFNGTVTVALGHDGSLFQNARLSGTLVVNVVNGVATFGDLSVDEPGMGYTLKASASNLTAGTSAAFNVTL